MSTESGLKLHLRLLTWNILADSYAKATPSTASSSSASPSMSSPTNWLFRRGLLERTLFAIKGVDFYTLQEVDHYHDFYQPLFEQHRYQTLFAQRPRKHDGCLLAYGEETYNLIASEIIDLDRLAYLDQSSRSSKLATSRFAKQNLGLLAFFQHKQSKQLFLVVTCHIHWNPNLPEVKFAQVTMILQEMEMFLKSQPLAKSIAIQDLPIVWTGDFNSFPADPIYDYITSIESRKAQVQLKYHEVFKQVSFGNQFLYGPNTKFLCEASLIRLSRWMRMLGVDVAMGSWEVGGVSNGQGELKDILPKTINEQTKKQAINSFFQRAKDEKRVILTTSRTLCERANCPQSFYVNPSKQEEGLVSIYREFGLPLQRERFLTVCGKCGGEIQEANLLDPRLMGKIIPCDRAVFQCIACAQVTLHCFICVLLQCC
jgi:mRNA deadenylase 3'-5' endonuclease subunit Ccr4